MKRLILGTVVMLALAACNEDEETETIETESSAAPAASQPATPTENTATADDAGGAMDGAPAMTSSEVSQDAIDSCIDSLRATAGPIGGTVTSTEFSEANSLVMLEDANGGVWRCIVSNDGSNSSVEAVGGAPVTEDTATADDGGGAMDGAETAMPSTGSPTDVSDFVGAPAGQASGGLQALGFEAVRTEGLTTWWFNRDTGACARITTSDGVFSEVTMLPAEDC